MTGKPTLDRVRQVTENYFFWQGLRWIPPGFLLVAAGLSWSDGWPLTGVASDAVLLAVIVIGVLASTVIGRHYRRVFGQVQGIPGQHQRRNTIKWALVYPAMAASLVIDGLFEPQFFISGLVWGASVTAYWWSTGRGRPHYLIAAAILFAFAFLPVAGLVAAGRPILSFFFVVMGGIYIVGGVLDHLELRKVLPPIPPDGEHP